MSNQSQRVNSTSIQAAVERAQLVCKPSIPNTELKSIKMGGGPKIPYPKHVWSPAGGWYTQPANWKANVLVFGAAVFGIAALTWNTSANEEYRDYMPRPDRFYPSRYWTKQVKEHEKAQREAQS